MEVTAAASLEKAAVLYGHAAKEDRALINSAGAGTSDGNLKVATVTTHVTAATTVKTANAVSTAKRGPVVMTAVLWQVGYMFAHERKAISVRLTIEVATNRRFLMANVVGHAQVASTVTLTISAVKVRRAILGMTVKRAVWVANAKTAIGVLSATLVLAATPV